MRARRRWLVLGLAATALVGLAAPIARSEPAPSACVETARPDPSLPALAAEAQAFGFHDEELVLCSPGAPDGGQPTHLSARLWVPAACPPRDGCPGVLVVHGLGGTKETVFADARDLASRGLYVLAYDVRGQGQSGGQADMMGRDTIADEAHVLRWFHEHVGPTRTGVYGISQGGVHALMAAVFNCGPARAAALDSTIPCDAGGERWVDAIVPVQAPARFEDIVVGDGTCSQFMLTAAAETRLQPDVTASATRCLLDGTPLDQAVEAVDAAISDGGLDRDNGLRDYVSRVDRIDVPVYLGTSYFDRVVPTSVITDIYERLRARAADPDDPYAGTDVRLIISNDAHGDIGANFAVLSDLFTWLERQLEGDTTPLRDAPVASAQEWAGNAFGLEHDWPIAGTVPVDQYLSIGGAGPRLGPTPTGTSTGEVANVPVVVTGPWVPVVGSAVDAQTVGLLPGDSLRYESEPFTDLTEITGLAALHLWLSTPDGGAYGQVTVTLDEMAADGTSTQFARVRRGFSDLEATATEHVIPLSTTSWRVDPGNRLRLTITATDLFEAEPALTNRGIVVSHGPDSPSRVVLPYVDPFRTPPAGDPPAGSSFTENPLATLCAAFGVECPG